MTAGDAVQQALRRVSLFSDLSPQELDVLAGQVVQRHYDRNQLIFSQGDPGDGLYIVRQGHLSISRQGPEGDELIIAMYEPGEYVGELALFDEEPRSATATAVEETDVLFLSRSSFRDFVAKHPTAVLVCLTVVVRQLRRLTDIADELALLDVRGRLARRLLHLARQGMLETGDEEHLTRPFRITQQQLASMVGTSRESVNKHLNAFADEGLVRLKRGYIRVLDPQGLADCA